MEVIDNCQNSKADVKKIIVYSPVLPPDEISTNGRNHDTAVEASPATVAALQKVVGPSGGYLTHWHIYLLENIPSSDTRDVVVASLVASIEAHKVITVRFM
jgi:hypothetical protein